MLGSKAILSAVFTLAVVSVITTARAQEVSIPDSGLNAAIRQALAKPSGPLTEVDMLGLTNLSAISRNITDVQGLEAAQNLISLNLDDNEITNFNILTSLTKLTSLDLSENRFSEITIPGGMTNLTALRLENGILKNLILSEGLTKLTTLRLGFNQLSSLVLPADITNLTELSVYQNQLTDLTLPPSLPKFNSLVLDGNQLSRLELPTGMTNLSFIALGGNLLTSLTVPPDMTNLTTLLLNGNPLESLVLPESLAASNLAATVTALRNQGIPVFTYPLTVQITFPQQQPIGAFRFGITGPPGVYTVYSSTNLTTWEPLNFVNNPLGGIFYVDTDTHLSQMKFYRVIRQIPPTNMVFVPPTTFKMGSLPNDQDANANERPQTTVLLTHGYWIGKFEVTQSEYLSVMSTNPSTFTGDLSRPVESVTWSDATNYCGSLTERDLAAGRIPSGSRYRLPTEAEWECAARAGTSTRFSYGDDLFYAELTSYAWFLDLADPDLTTHPVGQKLPNPSGLYDVHGNVWEWCQDDYGALPGGTQIDPTGPVSTPLQNKVIRGGAYDYPNSSSRSASRLFRFPLSPDSDVGFRVVLVSGNLQ